MGGRVCICDHDEAEHTDAYGCHRCPCVRLRPADASAVTIPERMRLVQGEKDFDVLCWDTTVLHYWPEGLMAPAGYIPEDLDALIPPITRRVQ